MEVVQYDTISKSQKQGPALAAGLRQGAQPAAVAQGAQRGLGLAVEDFLAQQPFPLVA